MPGSNSMGMGKLLKRLRGQRGLSQEALAAGAGYSVGYIGMLERGVRVAPPETVRAIAAALQATDEQLAALLALADGSRERRQPTPAVSRPGAPFHPTPLATASGANTQTRWRRTRSRGTTCGGALSLARRKWASRVWPSRSPRCCTTHPRRPSST